MTPHAQPRIGGWLIVFAIVLLLFAIRTVIHLVALGPALPIAFSNGFSSLWKFSVLCEFAGNTLLVAAAVVLLVLFLRKRRSFRRAALAFVGFLVVFTVADLMVALSVPEIAARPTFPWRSIIIVVLSAGIATWYLLASQRVRDTFTR